MDFEMIDTKNSPAVYVEMYKLITYFFWTGTGRWAFQLLQLCWHHFHFRSIPLEAGRGTCAETCGLDDVFPPDNIYHVHIIHLAEILVIQKKSKRHTYQKLVGHARVLYGSAFFI